MKKKLLVLFCVLISCDAFSASITCPSISQVRSLANDIDTVLHYSWTKSVVGVYSSKSILIHGIQWHVGAGDFSKTNDKEIISEAKVAFSEVNGFYGNDPIGPAKAFCQYSFPGSHAENCGTQGEKCIMLITQ